ncbi:FAD/NAD(P)-binding protein [Dyadobacter luticola]|uniref:FAD-dependent urate hydroxylase HpyO/Asp monooxygenase CreE-like FAD/NAD(P)-binding domain-containing protein n=1 Tax=Dyadobacter luticola TaxID=1979387 RepID=A0A5R9L144_9BACT|nr:FAD/NAD(P)-binding protein [Dyadobacter luticola]TLV02243.1 hypothetical protein FEN17_00965 [Dyadobacter luticola]
MTINKKERHIAILGGGPSALFMLKKLIESGRKDFRIDIFEAKKQLGAGMPYSPEGANREHITNVSDNEIPELVTSISEWVQTVPDNVLADFNLQREKLTEYHVLPRLLFGRYLSDQFELLLEKAKVKGFTVNVHFESRIVDISDQPSLGKVQVEVEGKQKHQFDQVVVCTGHNWPRKHEGAVPGFFDSPYPPSKLRLKLNHAIAIKGSSLTAIDAIRTMARSNGTFEQVKDHKMVFHPAKDSPDFKIVMHSRSGMLPAIRFHLEEPLLSEDSMLTKEELHKNMDENGGYLSLDYVFDKNFKKQFHKKDPRFYEKIKDLSLEDFVSAMMDYRDHKEPFQLFRQEYKEAEKSITERESIYWKEVLAVLSFTMNYPAKYLSAEDMIRLQKVLMPLISIVIAFVPQSSCEELFALHDAGRLEIVSVGEDSRVEAESKGGVTYHYIDDEEKGQAVYYKTYVDCVGQPHLSYEDFPYKGLLVNESVSPARIMFRDPESGAAELAKDNKMVEQLPDGSYCLKVSGITINDNFQIVNSKKEANSRIYMMAVPYIGGYNPDYSGLDFCDEASGAILTGILAEG